MNNKPNLDQILNKAASFFKAAIDEVGNSYPSNYEVVRLKAENDKLAKENQRLKFESKTEERVTREELVNTVSDVLIDNKLSDGWVASIASRIIQCDVVYVGDGVFKIIK